MSIGSITSAVTSAASSGSTLASLLQTSGLSADKIKIVEGDLADTQQSLASSMSASVSGTVDSTAFRAAIDAKIADDVASGKLTAKDAEAVGKALDQIERAASGASASADASGAASVTAAAAGSARPAGGHDGGGGGDTKTEVSRVETVVGGIMTTVITYSDGTTETQTSVTTDPDTGSANAASGAKAGKSDEQKAQDYLASLQPGTLFNVMA